MLIDRCNFDVQQRSHWLQLGRTPRDTSELDATVHHIAVFLDVAPAVALKRVLKRPRHEGQVDSHSKTYPELRTIVRRFSSMLVPPDEREGFERVLVCSSHQGSQVVASALRAVVRSADAGLGFGPGWEVEQELAAEAAVVAAAGAAVAVGCGPGGDAATRGDARGQVGD